MSAAALRWFRHRPEGPLETLPYGARELQRLQARHLQLALLVASSIGLLVGAVLSLLAPRWLPAPERQRIQDHARTRTDFLPPPAAPTPPTPRPPVDPAAGKGLPVSVPDVAMDTSWTPHFPGEPSVSTSPSPAEGGEGGKPRVGAVAEPLPGAVTPSYVEEFPIAVVRVEPEYPEIARQARVEGVVLVRALVGVDGRVRETRLVGKPTLFDESAVEAVRRWVFRPAQLNGRPVAVWIAVPVRYDLR